MKPIPNLIVSPTMVIITLLRANFQTRKEAIELFNTKYMTDQNANGHVLNTRLNRVTFYMQSNDEDAINQFISEVSWIANVEPTQSLTILKGIPI